MRTRWGDEILDEYDARREGARSRCYDRNPYDNFGVSRAEQEAHDAWERGHRESCARREEERYEEQRAEERRAEQKAYERAMYEAAEAAEAEWFAQQQQEEPPPAEPQGGTEGGEG